MKSRRIAVLMGGCSSEREISLKSGSAIARALKKRGLKVVMIDVNKNISGNLQKEKVELAFIALHGKYGEDGTIQGLLELLDIPYTGSGVLSSALSLNKIYAKKIFKIEGIPTPPFQVIKKGKRSKDSKRNELRDEEYPVVVKPSSQGSTIGVTIVREEKELDNAMKKAFLYDKEVLMEKYIAGREITASVLGNDNPCVLPLIEIVTENGFYDYKAKYTPGKSRHIIPPRLPPDWQAKAQEVALAAHSALGCEGFSRSEIIIDEKGNPHLLEVNTIPGMTEISLYPESAKAAGIEFGVLCVRLLELALEKHNEKRKK